MVFREMMGLSKVLDNKVFVRLMFWVWLVGVVIVNVIPRLPDVILEDFRFGIRVDYLLHFLVYFVLGFLFVIGKFVDLGKFRIALYVIFFGIAFSFVTEWVQCLIPGRAVNPIDFLSNSIGMVVGVAVSMQDIAAKRRKIHKKSKEYGVSSE